MTPPTTFNNCTTLNQSPNLVLKSRAKSLLIMIVIKLYVKWVWLTSCPFQCNVSQHHQISWNTIQPLLSVFLQSNIIVMWYVFVSCDIMYSCHMILLVHMTYIKPFHSLDKLNSLVVMITHKCFLCHVIFKFLQSRFSQ